MICNYRYFNLKSDTICSGFKKYLRKTGLTYNYNYVLELQVPPNSIITYMTCALLAFTIIKIMILMNHLHGNADTSAPC